MLNLQLEQLKRLPQRSNETWQGGLFRMPSWVTGEGDKPFRAWVSSYPNLYEVSEPQSLRMKLVGGARVMEFLGVGQVPDTPPPGVG